MNFIAMSLKTKVESFSEDLVKNNIFFHKAEQGEITRQQIIYYLNNIAYVLQYTPIYLRIAMVESDSESLLQFFAKKMQEEAGHDQWAFNDLNALGQKTKLVEKSRLSRSLRNLVAYTYSVIHNRAKDYILYITFIEYLTTLYGPKLVAVVEKCGVEPSAFTSVYNHVELDRHHAAEGFHHIDEFFVDESEWLQLEPIIDSFMDHIHGFYRDTALYSHEALADV